MKSVKRAVKLVKKVELGKAIICFVFCETTKISKREIKTTSWNHKLKRERRDHVQQAGEPSVTSLRSDKDL